MEKFENVQTNSKNDQNNNVVVAKVIKDYDGRPLEEGEVLVLFPYNELDAESVSNPDCISTVSKAGRFFKCIKKAVPVEYAAYANKQFNDWQEEVLPNRRDGRCMIPQPDGTFKECPRKKGDNHCSCAECPDRDKYERKDKSFVSLDHAMDQYEFAFATIASAADVVMETEELSETQRTFISLVESLIAKSPKHALALLLMSLGYKGEGFAEKMQMSKVGANYVRSQVENLSPNGITSLGQIDLSILKANKCKNEEYYRTEANKALKTVIQMFF